MINCVQRCQEASRMWTEKLNLGFERMEGTGDVEKSQWGCADKSWIKVG